MRRMTVKRSDGRWAIANNDGATNREQLEKFPIAINRLAAYENTGLEPEEIIALIDQPNLPLTLEELREMDGEPVYVKQLKSLSFFHDGWMLVTGYGAIDREQSMVFCEYGRTWMAYRRKPEEGAT